MVGSVVVVVMMVGVVGIGSNMRVVGRGWGRKLGGIEQ